MTPDDVEELADALDADVPDAAREEFAAQFDAQDDLLAPLGDLDPAPAPDRDWWAPETDEYGAWLARCDIGNGSGPLDGLEVGVKDNVAVAGLPMTCGSPLLAEFTPREDATVVTRLLDAGARVVGKTNMDELAFGGSRETMRLKVTDNPRNTDHQPGSSSAGSGAAVAAGEVPAAIGSDTGGSVRFPAAWCGVVGVKPTRGLVSHTGFVQYAKTLDNVGVLAESTETAARVLDAIAGEDPRDERTRGTTTEAYADATRDPPSDLTIGLPEELFGNAPRLDDRVRDALADLEDAGATLVDISIPDFEYAMPAWLTIGMSEVAAYVENRGVNQWLLSDADPDLPDALNRALADEDDAFGPPILAARLYAEHLRRDRPADLARARRARRRVTAGVDDALADVDVLACTTVPMLAPAWGDDVEDLFTALANTGPFNVSGHPAVSVPCGDVDGLPVGLQFVADRGSDATALAAAARYEALGTNAYTAGGE